MGSQKQHIYILKGTDDNIEKFLNSVKNFYNKNIEIQKIEYKVSDVLSGLTSNQREIIGYANKYGYYDYPRRITSEELSQKIGINKDIVLENLRKAEKCIISKALNHDTYKSNSSNF